jgi:hypothetical protein
MRPSRLVPAIFLTLFVFTTGCGSEDPPTRPSPEPAAAATQVAPGIPIEVREDADRVGMLDPITLHAASREGMNVNVTVSYRGGETHVVRALASTCVRLSYPPQVFVYLQHDAAGDASDGLVEQELAYDLRPIIEYQRAQGWAIEPFYVRVITPAYGDNSPSGSKSVLIEP